MFLTVVRWDSDGIRPNHLSQRIKRTKSQR